MKLTTHHIIPKSFSGNNHYNNKKSLPDYKHRGLHMLFDNDLPHEQLFTIVDISGKAIQKSFRDDIMSVLGDYEIDEIYNHKCCNINKLVAKILESKQ